MDTAGNFYVIDGEFDHRRVVKLTAGSETPTVLPFTGLGNTRAWRWTAPVTSTSPTTTTSGC